MEYKIKTNYTKDMIIDFKRFTLNKKSFLKPAILYLLCIAVIVCSFIYNRKFELNFTTVIYPAIAIIGGIIITMVYYVKPKSDISQLENKEVEYIFNNEGVLLGEDLVKFLLILVEWQSPVRPVLPPDLPMPGSWDIPLTTPLLPGPVMTTMLT